MLFLTYRSFVNTLKRSLTSPKRLITTAVILLYYFWWFVRPLLASGAAGFGTNPNLGGRWSFPPLEVLDAIVFSIFAGLSLVLSLSMFGYRSSFKPADVDVLFPTPVNPRTVLVFRMIRDYLGTLLVPIFLILVTWRPLNVASYFVDVPHPQSAGYAFRALSVGFILTVTVWVSMGYALSLYVNRNDRNSEARKKVVATLVAVPCLTLIAYTVRQAIDFRSMGDFIAYTQQSWIRAFFFTATPASKIVMGPLEGSTSEMFFGISVLLVISGVSLYLALGQAGWMYDQAAVRGFGAESMRQLQRRGDYMGIVAEAARRGKVKVRKPGWFQRIRTRGFGALIWKDALIQWRSTRAPIIIFSIVGLTFILMPYLAGMRGRGLGMVGYMALVMQGFVTFLVATTTSQSGFTELLRRVDLQKPLPFGSQKIVMSEILSKALPSMLIPTFCGLVGLALFPYAWPEILAGAVFFPSLGAVVCALVCVIVLLFPEVDDVSQRGFRGLMMMIGLMIVGAPGVAVFLLIGMFSKVPILGAVPGAVINLGVVAALVLAAGSLYAGFNPSE